MAMQQIDRMAVNAAMDLLVSEREDGWLVAAQLVIDYGRTLSDRTGNRRVLIDFRSHEERITGYAQNVGTVEIDTSQTEQASVHRTGSSSSRIGAYCVEHLKSKHKVRFHHWKDTEVYWPHSAPERIRANRYFLRYDSKTGKPLSLGVTTWAARPANPLETLWGIVWLRIVDLLRFVRTGSLPKAQIHILALEMYKLEERTIHGA